VFLEALYTSRKASAATQYGILRTLQHVRRASVTQAGAAGRRSRLGKIKDLGQGKQIPSAIKSMILAVLNCTRVGAYVEKVRLEKLRLAVTRDESG